MMQSGLYSKFTGTSISSLKVSNWFANARRRLKNVVQESHCSWSKRLRLYNQFVQGNAELLSISSTDSIWNSDEEDNDSASKQQRPRGPQNELSVKPLDCTESDDDEIDIIDQEPLHPESAQYKKTMLQRYLNDSVEVMAASTVTSSEKTSVRSSSPSTTSSSTVVTTPSVYSRLYWPPAPVPPAPLPASLFPWLPIPSILHYMNVPTNGKVLHTAHCDQSRKFVQKPRKIFSIFFDFSRFFSIFLDFSRFFSTFLEFSRLFSTFLDFFGFLNKFSTLVAVCTACTVGNMTTIWRINLIFASFEAPKK